MAEIRSAAAIKAEQDPPLSPIYMVVFLSLVVPLFFEIGSLYLSLSRVVLLVLTPILLFKLFAGRFGKLLVTDYLVLGYMFWFSLSTLKNNPQVFLTFVGSNTLILLGGYLVGRACIRGPRSARQMIFVYCGTILLTFPFALYETLTSHMVIARALDMIPGVLSSADTNYDPRKGFYRVQVIFVHPIHYGLFCTMGFALVFAGLKGSINNVARWLWSGVILLCCFFSVSSGPLLGIIMQILLLTYGYLTLNKVHPWRWLIRMSIAGYILLEVLSTRPAYFAIAERLAFSSGTAYARKTVLDFGLAQINRTPIFGVGAGREWALPDWMTGSLDNHWLLVAMVYGLPAFALLLGAYVYTLWKASRMGHEKDPELKALHLGWSITVVGTMLTLATVAIWSDIATLGFLLLGSGVWLTVPQTRDTTTQPEEPTPDPRRTRYSRFPTRPAVSASTSLRA